MIDLSLGSNIIINSEFEAALQELDILFNTETTELINDPYYGCNFEQFLWQMTPAVDSIKSYIIEKIQQTLFLSRLKYDVQVNLYKGEIRYIYDVQIHVADKKGNTTIRKYQFR